MKKRKLKFSHIIFLVLVCYFGYTLLSQQLMISRKKSELCKYKEQNKKIEEENKYLSDQIEYSKTDEYKEKLAREKIGLIKPGEVVYVIHDKD